MRGCDEATASIVLQNVEHLSSGNPHEAQNSECTATVDTETSEQRKTNEKSVTQVEVREHGILTDDNELVASRITVVELSLDAAELNAQCDSTTQSEDYPGNPDTTGQTDAPRGIGGTSSASESNISEPKVADSDPTASRFGPCKPEDGNSLAVCGEASNSFLAAETGQQLQRSVTEEKLAIPELNVGQRVNSSGQYRISNVEELIRANTVPIRIDEGLHDAEAGPPTTSDDHSHCAPEHWSTEHSTETETAAWSNDTGEFHSC